jgi:hypothetical protein
MKPKIFFLTFVSGFLSTMIFHQGGYALLWLAGPVPVPPWNFELNSLHIPKIFSLAFFGGLWAVPMFIFSEKFKTRFGFWKFNMFFGAIFPTLVAAIVVFPLKGISVDLKIIGGGLILNGLWGIGGALFYRIFNLSK